MKYLSTVGINLFMDARHTDSLFNSKIISCGVSMLDDEIRGKLGNKFSLESTKNLSSVCAKKE